MITLKRLLTTAGAGALLAAVLLFGGKPCVAKAAAADFGYTLVEDETGKFVRGLMVSLAGVYTDASSTSACIDIVNAGEGVRVLGRRGDYYRIRCNSQVGYVHESCIVVDKDVDAYLESSDAFKLSLLVLEDTFLSGAGTVGAIDSVQAGDVLTALERVGAVYKVEHGSVGGYAYVAADKCSPFYDVKYHKFTDVNFEQMNNEIAQLQRMIDEYQLMIERQAYDQAVTMAESVSSVYDVSVLESTTPLRREIVKYALQFVGNPYVWGGTDLVNGADCSGFCQSVLAHFGIDVSRCSYTQCYDGTSVELDALQPGDLVFYKRGLSIGHVVMYIGDGNVVQARGKDYGICITSVDYNTPFCARNVID